MPVVYKVRQGEGISALAEKFGFFEATIWDDPANEELRAQRHDMNILQAGDVVTIPDLRRKELAVATGELHRFRRKGIPALFRIQLFHLGEPRAEQDYRLEVDGTTVREGTTDADGVVEEPMSPSAKRAILTVGEDQEVLEFLFGGLDPIDTPAGLRQRLSNLGLFDGPLAGAEEDDPGLTAAIRRFQRREELEETGIADADTRDQLRSAHDERSDATQ